MGQPVTGRSRRVKSYFGEPVCETIAAGDMKGDCSVDFANFELAAPGQNICHQTGADKICIPRCGRVLIVSEDAVQN